jgi:cytochrome c553
VSKSTFIPILAGVDPAAIFKQLDDYRSGKRPWDVMGAMAKALSTQDSADVAAYYFYCVINAIGLQVVGASTDSMDIARGISRARR